MNAIVPRATIDQIEAHRACRVCHLSQPLDSAHFAPTTNRKYFNGRCRRCDAEAARIRWANSPTARAQDKAARDARRESIRAYDRMRAKRDRAKKRRQIDAWIEKNRPRVRETMRAVQQRRRARLRDARGVWTAEDLSRALAAQKSRCWWCGVKLGETYHADHRFALADGGSNEPGNIVVSCAPCNQSKGVKTPWAFAGRLL